MSALDFSYSPSVESVKNGIENRSRFDLVESKYLVQDVARFESSSIRPVEEIDSDEFFSEQEGFAAENKNALRFLSTATEVQVQEIAARQPESKAEAEIKKNVATVASPSEVVGTEDALARLDQNGDGRIDQVEVQKGIRAKEESTTFAALSQYQKSLEIYQKFSDSEDTASVNLFEDQEIQVERLFDEQSFEQDLYQDEYQQPENEAQQQQHAEVIA